MAWWSRCTHDLGAHNTYVLQLLPLQLLLRLRPITYCYYPDKVADHLKAWATKRCCLRCRFPFSLLRDAVVVLSATTVITLRLTTIILQLSFYLLLVGA